VCGVLQVKHGETSDTDDNEFKQVCYVRITGIRNEKFVEFDFSVGDPTLYIELVLPFSQFAKFCKQYKPKELTPEQEAMVDYDRLKWRYGQPGHGEL